MSRHTPGPWKAEPLERGGVWIYGANHRTVIDTQDADTWPPNEADTKLMLAAPNLVETCKAVFKALEELDLHGQVPWARDGVTVFEELNDAVFEATGEKLIED